MLINLRKFLELLSSVEKKLIILIFMILIMELIDIVDVASIMPFMAVLANPELIKINKIIAQGNFLKLFKKNDTFSSIVSQYK